METYSYTAVAKDGKDKKGQIEAETSWLPVVTSEMALTP